MYLNRNWSIVFTVQTCKKNLPWTSVSSKGSSHPREILKCIILASWLVSKVCYSVSIVELKELLSLLVMKLNFSILLFSSLQRKHGKDLLVEEWLQLSMDGWWVRIFYTSIFHGPDEKYFLFTALIVSLDWSKDVSCLCKWLVGSGGCNIDSCF